MEENSKRKIQVGVICHFKRDKKGNIISESIIREPIYKDWTPELQAAKEKILSDFAKDIARDIDMSIFETENIDENLRQYRQQQAKEQQRKKELQKIKKNMTDADLEEFLKWKEEQKLKKQQ